MNVYIVKLFSLSGGRSTNLVFWSATAVTKFQGDPLSRGIKYTGWENFVIFD